MVNRHGNSLAGLLLADCSHQELHNHAHVCNTVSKVCQVLTLAACALQAELEEQCTGHYMESKCAQVIRDKALEQQQSLDHCVESLMVASTNLCDAKEQIEVNNRFLHCPPGFFIPSLCSSRTPVIADAPSQ